MGDGRQYFPWISMEDQVRAMLFAISHTELAGPVNLTGPAPVTNGEFTSALGRALNRPTPMIVPGFALRAVLGEFADEGLLGGQRAIPAALEQAGFVFHHADGTGYGGPVGLPQVDVVRQVLGMLEHLGFKPTQARALVDKASRVVSANDAGLLLQAALRAS